MTIDRILQLNDHDFIDELISAYRFAEHTYIYEVSTEIDDDLKNLESDIAKLKAEAKRRFGIEEIVTKIED